MADFVANPKNDSDLTSWYSQFSTITESLQFNTFYDAFIYSLADPLWRFFWSKTDSSKPTGLTTNEIVFGSKNKQRLYCKYQLQEFWISLT